MKLTTIVSALLIGTATVYSDAPGVTESEILLGQSCALEGPGKALGTGMKAGLHAAFAEMNEKGGINGRKIKLISLDDGYEPEKTIANTHTLIEKEKVFLLIGEVGTPTSLAAVPIAEKASVPFFAPFTGAEFLRNPFKKYVVNIRASYNQEMEALAAYLVDKKNFTRIACFYQNDGYGRAGLSGMIKALKKRDMELAAEGTYERNTVAVKSGLLKVRRAKPEAVVMVGAYKPCAQFIKLAKKAGMKDTVYCNISFVGTKALAEELGEAGEGCIISQVVVFPENKEIPLVNEFHKAMAEYQPDATAGFVSLEGYLAGKVFAEIAEKTPDLTRENFLKTLETISTLDMNGMTLGFGPQDHQGMDDVFLTIIRNGAVQPLEQ